MFQIVRNYYNAGLVSGPDVIAAQITAGTLKSGDVLVYALTNRAYGYINGSTLVLATN